LPTIMQRQPRGTSGGTGATAQPKVGRDYGTGNGAGVLGDVGSVKEREGTTVQSKGERSSGESWEKQGRGSLLLGRNHGRWIKGEKRGGPRLGRRFRPSRENKNEDAYR